VNWDELAALAGRRVHIVGVASTEGAAILGFLWGEGFRDLTVHDFLAGEELRAAFRRLHVGMPRPRRDELWAALEALPVQRRLGDEYLAWIEKAEVIFAGQGWYLYPPNFPALRDARERGVPFHSLTELYFGLSRARIVAVTGSNGKSTTSQLAASMLRASGARVTFAGNERRSIQALDGLRASTPSDHLVLEVSNRQLKDFAPRPGPSVGVVTNILPNHLEEHGGSFADYAETKRNLLRHQSVDDAAVLNADDDASVVSPAPPALPGFAERTTSRTS
jgi:UDP-N-acetylmuramoylalanine-D-glutamate ligase